MIDAIGAENVGQGDDTEYFADVGAAHDRERVEVCGAHAFESDVERMIEVDVRKGFGVEVAFWRRGHDFRDGPEACAVVSGTFELRSSDHAEQPSPLGHGPGVDAD